GGAAGNADLPGGERPADRSTDRATDRGVAVAAPRRDPLRPVPLRRGGALPLLLAGVPRLPARRGRPAVAGDGLAAPGANLAPERLHFPAQGGALLVLGLERGRGHRGVAIDVDALAVAGDGPGGLRLVEDEPEAPRRAG